MGPRIRKTRDEMIASLRAAVARAAKRPRSGDASADSALGLVDDLRRLLQEAEGRFREAHRGDLAAAAGATRAELERLSGER